MYRSSNANMIICKSIPPTQRDFLRQKLLQKKQPFSQQNTTSSINCHCKTINYTLNNKHNFAHVVVELLTQ